MIERGDFIHYVLSGIKKIEGTVEEILEKRIKLAAGEKGFREDTSEIIKVLKKVFALAEVKEWFSHDGENEKEVAVAEPAEGGKSGIMRIDRFVANAGDKTLVIEYKTGADTGTAEKHKKQISEYIDAVRNICPEKNIEGYLLYIDEAKIVKI